MAALLGKIVYSRSTGVPPFRCHKGHWPGPPCRQPAELFREGSFYSLHHPPHEWEAVGVSGRMASFLANNVFVSPEGFANLSPFSMENDLKIVQKELTRGVSPFWCHKGHRPGPACGGPVTVQREYYGSALFHVPPAAKPHDWEAVYVSEDMAKFLRDYLQL